MQSLKDRLEGLESRIRQRDQHMGDTPSLSPERTSSFEKHQQLPILDFASTSSAMATKKRRISLDEDEDEYVESRELRRLEQYVPATVSIMPRVNSEPLDIPLLDAYFEHVYPFMPLIHRRYFFQGSSLPAFLLKSMYAAACIYTSETERGKKFYQQARELVDQCMDSASLWTIHGLLSLVIYGGYLPSAPSTSSYLAMAIRMAQNLRLYRESSAPSPEIAHFPLRIQKEFRRRLWWFCYKVHIC